MATVTLTRGTTLPDSSGKADFHALVDSATATVANIVNADIDAAAAIADTKLAQITTAGKVSGAAITTINSLPSGAGAIPIANLSAVLNTITAWLLIDGSGSPITAGVATGCIPVPFTGTITNIKVFADVATTTTLDLWMDDFASYPPTVADTITASAKPALTADLTYTDSTLTGWTTAVTAGDVIKINVDSNDLATWLVVAITFTRTA